MSILSETEEKMKGAMSHLHEEYKNLRTNRANPSMLDSVEVECYGTKMRLRDLGTVSVPEARQLLITAFDPQTAGPIAKGIEKTNLGFQSILEGNQVRIPIPPMSEEMRKEIAKEAKKKAEDAKISIREARRKGNHDAKKAKSDGEVTEDEQKKMEKKIQELTDKYCHEVDQACAKKEKDILEV